MDMSVIRANDPATSRWAYLLGQLGGENNGHAALRAVLRGEQPLGSLIATIAEGPLVERITRPHVRLCAADLAQGIMNLKDDPAALSEWAGFILATSEMFDLEDELSECWDRLLPCIWDLAFGADLSSPAITLAGAVRNHHCGSAAQAF